MTPLSLATAKGCMKLIDDGAINGDFNAFGIGEQEYKIMTKAGPWLKNETAVVRRTMEVMIFGVMEELGLPRFQPPAEYIASVIAMFVSGTNCMSACRLMEGGSAAAELAANPKHADLVSAEQLFAMVASLHGGDEHIRTAFEKRAGFALSRPDNDEAAAKKK